MKKSLGYLTFVALLIFAGLVPSAGAQPGVQTGVGAIMCPQTNVLLQPNANCSVLGPLGAPGVPGAISSTDTFCSDTWGRMGPCVEVFDVPYTDGSSLWGRNVIVTIKVEVPFNDLPRAVFAVIATLGGGVKRVADVFQIRPTNNLVAFAKTYYFSSVRAVHVQLQFTCIGLSCSQTAQQMPPGEFYSIHWQISLDR